MIKPLYSLFFILALSLSPWGERVQTSGFEPNNYLSSQSWSFLPSFPQIEGSYQASRFGSFSSNPLAHRAPSLKKDEKKTSPEKYLSKSGLSIRQFQQYEEIRRFLTAQATLFHFDSFSNKSPPAQSIHTH